MRFLPESACNLAHLQSAHEQQNYFFLIFGNDRQIQIIPKFIGIYVSLQSNFIQRIRNFRWFCHFDDDNYVNIHRLQQFLSDYDAALDWYIGKPSTGTPLEISPNEVSSPTIFFCYWRSTNYNNGSVLLCWCHFLWKAHFSFPANWPWGPILVCDWRCGFLYKSPTRYENVAIHWEWKFGEN